MLVKKSELNPQNFATSRLFFKQCKYQFTISLTSKEIDGPNVVLVENMGVRQRACSVVVNYGNG
jgi:hypothetical protein